MYSGHRAVLCPHWRHKGFGGPSTPFRGFLPLTNAELSHTDEQNASTFCLTH
jgi:hypothetical protein